MTRGISNSLWVVLAGALLSGCSCDGDGAAGSGGGGSGGASGGSSNIAGAAAQGGAGGAGPCISLGAGYTILDERYCNDGLYHAVYSVDNASTDPAGGLLGENLVGLGYGFLAHVRRHGSKVDSVTLPFDIRRFGTPSASARDFFYRFGTSDYLVGRVGWPDQAFVFVVTVDGQAISAVPDDGAGAGTMTPDGSTLLLALSSPEPGIYRQSVTGMPPTIGARTLLVSMTELPSALRMDSDGTLFALVGPQILVWSAAELASQSSPHIIDRGTDAEGELALRSATTDRPAMVLQYVHTERVVDAAEYQTEGSVLSIEPLTGLVSLDGGVLMGLDETGAIWLNTDAGISILRPN
ncbi:MAG: hypothetical protein U0271_16025 [Polyangiaceae bacterium]